MSYKFIAGCLVPKRIHPWKHLSIKEESITSVPEAVCLSPPPPLPRGSRPAGVQACGLVWLAFNSR